MHLQLKWKIKVPIPGLAKYLPNDYVNIYKKGNRLRGEWKVMIDDYGNITKGKYVFLAVVNPTGKCTQPPAHVDL